MTPAQRLAVGAAGLGAAACTLAASALGGATAYHVVESRSSTSITDQQTPPTTQPQPTDQPQSGQFPQWFPSEGQAMPDLGGSAGASASTQASADQVRGVVDIVSQLDFGESTSAGTGIILTASGRILTNNHVIEDSTQITVTDLTTGRSYEAEVVGTSPTNDVAVLQLTGASGLTPAALGDSGTVQVGDQVVGVGNAGNEAGTSAAAGRVTAIGASITAGDASGGSAESLTGLIATDAGIRSGDSGGPLYDADGAVVGIDTAAQTSGRSGVTVAGYAIPINHALSIAEQIVGGVDDQVIHQGVPAFLGVRLSSQSSAGAAVVAGTVAGSAAERGGLSAGDTVTALDGKPVNGAAALKSLISTLDPGDQAQLTWTDASGQSHTTTVTLGEGPAD